MTDETDQGMAERIAEQVAALVKPKLDEIQTEARHAAAVAQGKYDAESARWDATVESWTPKKTMAVTVGVVLAIGGAFFAGTMV